MSRSVSSALRASLNAQETSEVYVVLLKIDHTDMSAPIFVCNNSKDIINDGDTYVPFPFKITLVDEKDTGIPIARLQIDNIDRNIVQNIRPLSSAPTVTIKVVMASSPSTEEAGPIVLTLTNVTFTAFVVSGQLSLKNIYDEPYPKTIFNPTDTPGVFAGL